MSREILDPKLLKKAAPRVPVPEKTYKDVVLVPDFPGEEVSTGKIGLKTTGKFDVYNRRLNAGASSATYFHGKKSKIVTVIFGTLTVYFTPAVSSLDSEGDVVNLESGHSLEITPLCYHQFKASNGPVVFTNIEECGYQARLQVDESTEITSSNTGIDAVAYSPAPRYKSKAREQLAAMTPKSDNQPEGILIDDTIGHMPESFEGGF